MLAEPGVRAVNCRGHTTRIRAGAIRIEFGSDQLRRHRIGQVLTGGLLHKHDGLGLGILNAAELYRLHAPRFGMIRPIALSGDLTVASRVRSSWLAYSALTTVVNGAEIAVVARGAIRFLRIRTDSR